MPLLNTVILRSTRALQPAATAVPEGTLYCVTDEGNLVERSNGAIWQAFGTSSGSGSTGTATLDFGAFPGRSDASLAVTGQAAIASGSILEAWMRPAATADHSADEHILETIKIFAGNIVPGVGFTIYGVNDSQLNEPVEPMPTGEYWNQSAAAIAGKQARPGKIGVRGGIGTRIYGTWSLQWRWS